MQVEALERTNLLRRYSFFSPLFSKMVIFNKLGYIKCGIEVVPGYELVKQMSTGVSSYDQLLVDLQHRGESNIDIPVFIVSLGLTDKEKTKTIKLQDLFRSNKKEALKRVRLRKYNGSLPGPK